MPIPNKNNRYQNSDASSIFNIKQNLNSFYVDLSYFDYNSLLANGKFDVLEYMTDTVTKLFTWELSGSIYAEYNKDLHYLPVVMNPSGYLKQSITHNLKPNTNYTMIFYGSAEVGNAIKVQVKSDYNDRIVNLNDPSEINCASFLLNVETSGASKYIATFKTTSVSATPDSIYVKIENISASGVNVKLSNVLVYNSLIEIGDLPYGGALNSSNGITDTNGLYNEYVFGPYIIQNLSSLIVNITGGMPNSNVYCNGAVSGMTTLNNAGQGIFFIPSWEFGNGTFILSFLFSSTNHIRNYTVLVGTLDDLLYIYSDYDEGDDYVFSG